MSGVPAFPGIWPVLQVPFGPVPGQPVDRDALAALARVMAGSGAAGIVVLGLGSEAWKLTEEERAEVVAIAVAHAERVVVGIDGHPAVALERIRRATHPRVVGYMVLPPRDVRDQALIARHYRTLADAAGVPCIVQDSPQMTGTTIAPATFVELARSHPLLRIAKLEAPGSGPLIDRLVGEGLEAIAGWGGMHYLDALARGATGCFPGSDLGPALVDVHADAAAGRADVATAGYERILPVMAYAAQSLDLLLLAAKRALVRRGIFPRADLRAPAADPDPRTLATIDAYHARLAAAGVAGFPEVSA